MGAAERPQHEGERDQRAVEQREQKRARLDRWNEGERKHGFEAEGNGERQCRPGEETEADADEREQSDLGEIKREDRAASRALRLQRRDRLALAVEVMLD